MRQATFSRSWVSKVKVTETFSTLLSHIAYQILIKRACVPGHSSSAFMSHVSCITV